MNPLNTLNTTKPEVNRTLKIEFGERSYPVIWENNFEALKEKIGERLANSRAALITNDQIAELYSREIKELFGDTPLFVIPEGEAQKRLQTIEDLSDKILAAGFHRNSDIWSFGGGVIGDIGGFLASVYMRGVGYYQVPTTLLSMVDSSVGGKTGVNLKSGKNMVGSFYQPKSVFIHSGFLKTLHQREIACGLAEIIKSALIRDAAMFQFIEDNRAAILANSEEVFARLSQMSVEIKAKVVEEDEKEGGLRAILNFGHTLAHALESYYEYGVIKHGEAVAVGMAFAARLSAQSGPLSSGEADKIVGVMESLNLPCSWDALPNPKPQIDVMIDLMRGDKKNTGSEIKFVLIDSIGSSLLPGGVDDNMIRECLEKFICQPS